jgi:glycosyltransferase involved in cell wall biosynthesis
MPSEKPLSITYYYREPRPTGQSIEGIFKLVKNCLQDKADIKEFYCTPGSRLKNIRNAGKFACEVSHITGDVNFLALGLRGKKVVLTIHDFGFYENPVHSKMVKSIYRLFWFYLPLKYVDIVTVVSEFTKQKLIQYFNFPVDRIRVIHDPVKPIFTYTKKEVINDPPRVLMIGTGKHKNLNNLIEAVKGTDYHIDIIGWPAQDELDKLNKYGIQHIVYNKLTEEEVYQRYVNCDVMFNASYYEGFGMPVIEAQAVGRPVITSNLGAMKEVGEGSAILVDPAKPDEIRAVLLSLKAPRFYGEVVAKGRENAAKYDHRKIAEQYLQVYKELAAK